MICEACNGNMTETKKDVTLKRSGRSYSFHNVRVHICDACGNEVLADGELVRLEKLMDSIDKLRVK